MHVSLTSTIKFSEVFRIINFEAIFAHFFSNVPYKRLKGSNFRRSGCALSKGGVSNPEMAHPRTKIGEEPPPGSTPGKAAWL